jgi:hypothetical protein
VLLIAGTLLILPFVKPLIAAVKLLTKAVKLLTIAGFKSFFVSTLKQIIA